VVALQDNYSPQPFIKEQRKDKKVAQIIEFLEGNYPMHSSAGAVIG